jgi:Zn-dependent peptidase ImmA (M78 family)/DNA-binding transcriptional regulator YiaG
MSVIKETALQVKAKINPDLLVWARETSDFTEEAAAKKLRIDVVRLQAWESGDATLSIPQLRKLSELYKRPLAVFFMPKRPKGFDVLRDFRKNPDDPGDAHLPALALEIRKAQQRREVALDLFIDIGDTPPAFSFRATSASSPDEIGTKLRSHLGVTMDIQSRWRDTSVAFRNWRTRIENAGALVFNFSTISANAVRGFSIAESKLPVIAFNRKDAPAGRTFTMLHECAHLALRVSGVCDLHEHGARKADDEHLETFCNAIAAAALMPADEILKHPTVVTQKSDATTWSDEAIEELARYFGCSREATVRRLFTLNKTTKHFYELKRKEYKDEGEAAQARNKLKLQKPILRNVPQETVAALGRPLINLAFSSYYAQRITLNELSDVLGVKARHVLQIEKRLNAA